MLESSLKKRYIFKLISNILIALIAIVTVAIVPKALGSVAYGQFSYLQQFFNKVTEFLDSGTSMAFFTKLSANRERKELITFYLVYSIGLISIIYILLFLVRIFKYETYLFPGIPHQIIFYGAIFAFLAWLSGIFIKISDAYILTTSVEIIKIIHKFVFLIFLIYVINNLYFDLSIYFYFQYLSLLTLIMIISVLFIKKDIFTLHLIQMNIQFKNLAHEFIKYSSPLVIFNIVALLVGLFDIWLLQKMGGSVQTGYYGLANQIIAMSFLFTSAMTPIIIREFSKSYAEKNIEQMRKHYVRYVPMLFAIAAYFGVFISFQSENLLNIFTGGQFKGAYWVLVIMAFYPLHQTYGQLGSSVFYATGQTLLFRNIGMVSMLIGLGFSVVFIYILSLEAIGLALKMVFGQLISVNIQLFFNAKILGFEMKYFLKHQIITLIFFLVPAALSTYLFTNINDSIVAFLVSGVIYTTLVIIQTIFIPQVFGFTRDEVLKLIFKKQY